MDITHKTFRFPLKRTLPLLVAFLFLMAVIVGAFAVGSYHPIVTVILWLGLIGSGWYSLSDVVARCVVEEEGLRVRLLGLRGVRSHLIPWDAMRQLDLVGYMPDVLQLRTRKGVSRTKWTLPAHPDLAEAVVQGAGLRPDPANESSGAHQAFVTLQQTRGKRNRYSLHWRWRRRIEGGDER